MRKFNYINDYKVISISLKGYIEEMKLELQYLIEIEKKQIYEDALKMIEQFTQKYPNLYEVEKIILKDIISPENIEYFYNNKKYKENASPTGLEFQKDIQKLFEVEEYLKKIAIKSFQSSTTSYENIKNGEDFLIVGHSSTQLPGLPKDSKYKYNKYYGKHYISCSLISNFDLNTFNQNSIVYIVDVNPDNYLSGSYYDTVTRESTSPSIYTIGEASLNGEKIYIDAGMTQNNKSFALKIATPKVIEKLSVKRELKENKTPYVYTNSLTNEIVLDRDKTHCKGCLLIANETKTLFEDFIFLKRNNIDFKCINIGLYKEKINIERNSTEELSMFKETLEQQLFALKNELNNQDFLNLLSDYYKEVVIPMNYSDEILITINTAFSKYINLNEQTTKTK